MSKVKLFSVITKKIGYFFPLIALLLSATASVRAQTIRGTVIDSRTNETIAGAAIQIRGGAAGTGVVSDYDGNFLLKITQLPAVIRVSYLGYKPQEIEIYEASESLTIGLSEDSNLLNEVVITARRRRETLQDAPLPVSVLTAKRLQNSGAFNVNLVKEMTPSLQMYSSNPRNTAISIRGLGTTFGLTNDGIDPGVGFYIDGVYYARTASATMDFIDIEQIEVLRGPQGTLFGKNTTAGAINITTKAAEFEPSATLETTYGNYGFIQAKGSITGAISRKLAARLSFAGTQRDGLIYNVRTQKHTNDLNNLGGRLKLLYQLNRNNDIQLIADYTRQRPDGYAQVIAGIVKTQRDEYRQFETIISDLGYGLPSLNAFDRVIDHDTPWRSGQDFGGIALNGNFKLGQGTLTSTTAWRYWNWNPSNDRDFTGLQGLALSQAPSIHKQLTQEVRWAGSLSRKLSGVIGVFSFWQDLNPNPAHTEEAGKDQWRFSQNSKSELWKTPGLLDGYGQKTYPRLNTFSGAVYAQLTWQVLNDKLRLLPGIRFNYDKKNVDFKREVYGGLQTDDPDLTALKNSVYSNQAFQREIDKNDISGQLTVAYKPLNQVNTYATFATGFKPVGLNLGGLPRDNGRDMTELADIKPERVTHFEVGAKTNPLKGITLNITAYRTDVRDYQAQVQAADMNVNRGYLANAERIRVRGIEIDGQIQAGKHTSLNLSAAYTDGKYVKFTNAPLSLEETGLKVDGKSVYSKDISGGVLPGISEWALSFGGETGRDGTLFNRRGEYFIAFDGLYRSSFSSASTPSKYLVVDGYTVFNLRAGFQVSGKVATYIWSRNLFNSNYFEQLLPGAGNAGHYAGIVADPRTWGITIRYTFF